MFTTSAYADEDINISLDDEGSVSDPSILIDAESDYELRELSKDLSNSVYSTSDVRAVDYAESIYNYLYGVMQPTLLQIRNNTGGTNSTTLYSLVSDMKQYLNTINTSVQTPFIYGSSTPSIYGYMILIKDALVSASGNAAIDVLGNIENNTSAIASLSSNNGYKLDSINNNIIEYSQLNWAVYNNLDITVQYSDGQPFNWIDLDSNSVWVDDCYIKLNFSRTINPSQPVWRIRLPIYNYSYNSYIKPELYLYTPDNTQLQLVDSINIIMQPEYLYIYNIPFPFTTNSFVIHLIDDSREQIHLNLNNFEFKSLSGSYLSSAQFVTYLSNLNQERYLDKLTNIYASEFEINAREESTPQIQEALNDFTGSGSASAGLSDISSAKDISGSLKSGLSSGGSVSDSLSVFSSANAFWGWFSSDNASYFTVYSPSRSFQDWNNIEWTDDVPDVLTNIDREFYNELGDGER